MRDGVIGLYVERIPVTPGPCTSPNSRCPWQKRARAVKDLRTAARLAAVDAISRRSWVAPLPAEGPIALRWTVFLGRRERVRDFTNITGALKGAEDGIFDALRTNDARVVEVTVQQVRDPDGVGWMQCAVVALEGVW